MDNGLDNERCVKCGAMIALVGRVHNCKPRPGDAAAKAVPHLGERTVLAKTRQEDPGAAHTVPGTRTYQYRDPEKRRPQVAAAMRSYRQRKKANGAA